VFLWYSDPTRQRWGVTRFLFLVTTRTAAKHELTPYMAVEMIPII
jgi:hypothetical protein